MSRDNPFPPRPDTLHKRITAILQDWYTAAVVQDDDSHGYVDVYEVHTTRHEAVDRVLDAVRRAMLSGEAVKAGAQAITADPDFGDNHWTDDARNVLTAALRSVTQWGPEPGDINDLIRELEREKAQLAAQVGRLQHAIHMHNRDRMRVMLQLDNMGKFPPLDIPSIVEERNGLLFGDLAPLEEHDDA